MWVVPEKIKNYLGPSIFQKLPSFFNYRRGKGASLHRVVEAGFASRVQGHPVSSTAHLGGQYRVSGSSGGEDLALAVLMSTGDVQAPSSALAVF